MFSVRYFFFRFVLQQTSGAKARGDDLGIRCGRDESAREGRPRFRSRSTHLPATNRSPTVFRTDLTLPRPRAYIDHEVGGRCREGAQKTSVSRRQVRSIVFLIPLTLGLPPVAYYGQGYRGTIQLGGRTKIPSSNLKKKIKNIVRLSNVHQRSKRNSNF